MGALAKDIVSGGTSAGSAQAMNGRVGAGLTATGTIITDALDLLATVNVVTTVGAGSGVQLPSMMIGDQCEVYNNGANSLKIYPDQSTVAINQGIAGASVTLATNTGMMFRKTTATQIWAFLSA